jgi:hypothetical protein
MGRPGLDQGQVRRATVAASVASFALVIGGWVAINSIIDTDVVSAISVAHDTPAPLTAVEPTAAVVAPPPADEQGSVGAGALGGATPARPSGMAAQFERPECPSATQGEIAFSAHLRSVAITIQKFGREAANRKSYSGIAVCHPANRVAVYRVADQTLEAAIQKIARTEKIEVMFMPAAFSLSDVDAVQAYIEKNRAAWAAQGIEVPDVVPQADATLEVGVKGADVKAAQVMFKPYLKQVRIVAAGTATEH